MKLKNLAKKIALTALAAIYSTTDSESSNNSLTIPDNFDDRLGGFSAEKPNLLLKKPALDYGRYIDDPVSHRSHRSHRSHSSHRSHYSSSSGNRSYYTPTPKNETNSNSSSGSSPRIYTPSYSTPVITYTLGDRTLKQGMTGDDVTELKKKLSEKGYYAESGSFSNYFDSSTSAAVRNFQKDYGLGVDGIAGQTTILYLKFDLLKPSKTFDESTFPNNTDNYSNSHQLGDRILKYGMTGQDVKELKKLLKSKGYLILNESYKNEISFDWNTKKAIQDFQRDQGISSDGIVGKTTIQYLKSTAKYIQSDSGKKTNFQTTDTEEGKVYFLKESTSLRQTASSQSTVLKRFAPGDKVIVVNSVASDLWWKVTDISSGEIGWVKRNLLKK